MVSLLLHEADQGIVSKYCQASGSGLDCYGEFTVKQRLIVHELGHTFNAVYHNRFGDPDPYDIIAKASSLLKKSKLARKSNMEKGI